eukprot:768641-Hanusia_phi.AAC.1
MVRNEALHPLGVKLPGAQDMGARSPQEPIVYIAEDSDKVALGSVRTASAHLLDTTSSRPSGSTSLASCSSGRMITASLIAGCG